MVISLEGICKSFGAEIILSNITAKIEDSDRIGLIGLNGAGKTTLLNIITNDLESDSGVISRNNAVTIGFLRQNSGLTYSNTIQGEMLGVFSALTQMEQKLRQLEQQISVANSGEENYSTLTREYASLQGLFEQRGGYLISVKIDTILNGMGFLGVDRATDITVLSGGEKTRLALCKLLLEEPALLILDEPTNHLDFKTLAWLEGYLASYKGALLVVSHDRYFLDRLCTSIWEVEDCALNQYNGNYSQFVLQKGEKCERWQKEYDIQQQEIAQLKDFVARNIVRASTTARAKSKQKTLDKMEIIQRPKAPKRAAKIRFTYKTEPVKDVLHVNQLSLSVGEGEGKKTLCNQLDFDLLRQDKIALIGSNGVGKSTLLKALVGIVQPDCGDIDWGRNTQISYFEQEDMQMDPSKTVLDELWDRYPGEYEHTIRTVLGNVLLTGEDVYKNVSALSGGERAKLKFANLILSCGNVLLMDEPTNHLDLASKEALDNALKLYAGSLLVVSHDRYLLNKFPTKIAEMHSGGITIYNGNYDRYLELKQLEAPLLEPQNTTSVDKTASVFYRSKKQRSEENAVKKQVAQLEEIIEQQENLIAQLEQEISQPETASNYLLLEEKCNLLEQTRLALTNNLSSWAQLS